MFSFSTNTLFSYLEGASDSDATGNKKSGIMLLLSSISIISVARAVRT